MKYNKESSILSDRQDSKKMIWWLPGMPLFSCGMPLFSCGSPSFLFFKAAKKRSTRTREACRLSAIQLSFLILTFVGFNPAPGLFVSVKVDPWHSRKIYAKPALMSRPIFTKFELPKYSCDIHCINQIKALKGVQFMAVEGKQWILTWVALPHSNDSKPCLQTKPHRGRAPRAFFSTLNR